MTSRLGDAALRINPSGRKLTAEETREIFFTSGAGVRLTQPKEETTDGNPTPPLLDLDPRYIAGCALVVRYGSVSEISPIAGNQAEVRQININTNRWLAQQNRRAA